MVDIASIYSTSHLCDINEYYCKGCRKYISIAEGSLKKCPECGFPL